jgi:hypothetical protein
MHSHPRFYYSPSSILQPQNPKDLPHGDSFFGPAFDGLNDFPPDDYFPRPGVHPELQAGRASLRGRLVTGGVASFTLEISSATKRQIFFIYFFVLFLFFLFIALFFIFILIFDNTKCLFKSKCFLSES